MTTPEILIAFFAIFCFLLNRNLRNDEILKENSRGIDSCNTDLYLKSKLPFDTTSFHCLSVWNKQSYNLRYMRTETNIWSFVLSAPNSNAYIAMGFSKNGKMVGSNAIVGWVSDDGTASMKTYFLGGQSPDEVLRDEGSLQLVNFTSSVIVENSRIYMAFQLKTDMPSNWLIYSVGPTGMFPSTTAAYQLTEHTDHICTSLDYNTGIRRPYANLRRNHGLLCMFGWGIFLPIGVIIARYFTHDDPTSWFHFHTMFQSLGALLGFVGIVAFGFLLSERLQNDVPRHKGLGIVILVLGSSQAISFLVHPGTASTTRKFWKWYHYAMGSVLLILAPLNTFYGIYLGKAGISWNAGYALFLVILLITAAKLEIKMWKMKLCSFSCYITHHCCQA